MACFFYSMSLSLAYKELSINEKKRDERIKNLDPKKKEQVERLGMGAMGERWVDFLNSFSYRDR